MATTLRQGHGYTHIDLGKLLKNFNSKKKALMYLLNRKAMIPLLESTDWCVCKTKTSREARKDRMQDLSTGYSLGCHRLLERFSVLVNHAKWNTLLSMLKVSTHGILTDIVHGSQRGVTSPYLMRRDFFHLRIITQKQLTAAILLLVCSDMRFISFFPRVIKVSVRSLNMLCKFTTRFIYKLACSVGKQTC